MCYINDGVFMVNVDWVVFYGVIEGFFLNSIICFYNREKVKVVVKVMLWIFMNILKLMCLFKKKENWMLLFKKKFVSVVLKLLIYVLY